MGIEHSVGDSERSRLNNQEAIPDHEFVLPTTIDELVQFCKDNTFISANVRLRPGQRMAGIPDYEKGKAGGMYGMELLHGHQVIATSGFELWKDEHDQKFMKITHSPQGKKRNEISPTALRKLRSHDFRGRMVLKYLPLALAMDQDYIRGISAQNHPKVQRGDIPMEKGKKIMDDVYERCGYTRGEDGNYYIWLNPTNKEEFQIY
jgi:hypothetical protein